MQGRLCPEHLRCYSFGGAFGVEVVGYEHRCSWTLTGANRFFFIYTSCDELPKVKYRKTFHILRCSQTYAISRPISIDRVRPERDSVIQYTLFHNGTYVVFDHNVHAVGKACVPDYSTS